MFGSIEASQRLCTLVLENGTGSAELLVGIGIRPKATRRHLL